jgi:hypothetical protein
LCRNINVLSFPFNGLKYLFCKIYSLETGVFGRHHLEKKNHENRFYEIMKIGLRDSFSHFSSQHQSFCLAISLIFRAGMGDIRKQNEQDDREKWLTLYHYFPRIVQSID